MIEHCIRRDDCFTSWFDDDVSLADTFAAAVDPPGFVFQFESLSSYHGGVSMVLPRDLIVG